MGVRCLGGWPPEGDIPWGDHSAGSIFEPLVRSPDDIDAFEYIWQPPGPADLDATRGGIDERVRFAHEHHLPVQGLAGQGLATLMFVMGAQNTDMSIRFHLPVLAMLILTK